jgi:hypothetical protein
VAGVTLVDRQEAVRDLESRLRRALLIARLGGECLVSRDGRLEVLRPCRSRIQEAHPKPTKLGIGRVALARALWDAPPDKGRDRSRAAAQARQAGETGTPLGILGAHSAR